MTAPTQTWKVIEWGVVDGGILGALIECVECLGDTSTWCEMCEGDRVLHQPYRLPNGAAIDLERDAELLIQIEPPQQHPPVDPESPR